MKNLTSQRQPYQKKRSPWKRIALLSAPPIGCSAAGAAICADKGAVTARAMVGKPEAPAEEPGVGAVNGAAAGLVIGMVMAHAISWWKRR